MKYLLRISIWYFTIIKKNSENQNTMNAYGKMQMLLGFNNPCAAHSPEMVDDNEGMMEIIHESRENSAFIQFLRQNDDINYVYMKMRDTNYSLQEIKDTHKRFNQNEDDSVMQLWERFTPFPRLVARCSLTLTTWITSSSLTRTRCLSVWTLSTLATGSRRWTRSFTG